MLVIAGADTTASQGVVFTLIIIRVGLNETTSEHSKGHLADSRGAPPPLQSHAQQYPMRPLAISVSVAREHDRASLEAYDVDQKGTGVMHESDVESGNSDAVVHDASFLQLGGKPDVV